jgi:hypothetical protein
MSTQDDLRYVFFGSALALDASIGASGNEFLKDQTAAVLSFSGGHAAQTRERTHFHDLVRTGKVSVKIVGTAEHPDHFSTIAEATIEKLDIFSGFIKADAIVSRIVGIAPKEAPDNPIMHPTNFSFDGSAFHGLKINNEAYDPVIPDPALDIPLAEDQKPLFEVVPGKGFKVRADAVGFDQMYSGVERKKSRGPFMEIPEVGRIFLGERDFFRGRVTLSMLRVELRGKKHARVSGPVVCVNGHQPPINPVPGAGGSNVK